ncbi:TPA: hypothetical protein R5442_001689 [Campylobacter jejuni]|nr:hypothetical protein [Campylobacter jejuni]HEF3926791.1 hypothetical protein [Campylobacter jejuni]
MKKILILILVCFSSISAYNIEDELMKFFRCSHEDFNSCKKDYENFLAWLKQKDQNFLAWFKQKDQIVYYLRPKPFGCDRNYLLDVKKDIEKAIRLTFLKEAKLYERGKDPFVDINIWMTCHKSYNLGNQELIAGLVNLEFGSISNYLITRDVNLSYLDEWRYIQDKQIFLIFRNNTSELKETIEYSITYFGNIITNTAKAINQ